MKAKVEPKKDDSINYSFILKCLGGLTGVAIIVAGIIVSSTTPASSTGLAAAAIVASQSTPIIGLLAIIGGICLLPFLIIKCFSSSTRSDYSATNNRTSVQTPSPRFFSSVSSFEEERQQDNIHYHTNPGNAGGTVHHHGDSGTVHHHDDGGTVHHHDDGGTVHHHDDGGTVHHHDDGGTVHHHDDGGTVHHHDDGGTVHHHDDGGTVHHHDDGGTVHHDDDGIGIHMHGHM